MLTVTHAALRLEYAVQSSYKLNLPPHLTVHASNIKMTESIGQGKLKLVIIFSQAYVIVSELFVLCFQGNLVWFTKDIFWRMEGKLLLQPWR